MEHRPSGGLSTTDPLFETAGDLGRMFPVVLVYPYGHPRIHDILTRIVGFLRGLGPYGALDLEVADRFLIVQSRETDMRDKNIAALHDTLHALGITWVRFHSNATAEDLHAFAVVVSEKKAGLTRSGRFLQVNIREELPASIQVEHRSFGATVGAGGHSHQGYRPQDLVRYILDATPDAEEWGAANEFVTRVVTRLIERIEHAAVAPPDRRSGGRGLERVLDLCARAMKTAIHQMSADGRKIREIGKLASNMKKAIAMSKDLEAVNVLLDVLQLASNEIEQEAQRFFEHRVESEYDLTLEELCSQLAECAENGEPIGQPTPDETHIEQLSILLQLSQRERRTGQLRRIGEAIRASYDAIGGAARVQILAGGISDFVNVNGTVQVDVLLPIVVATVRPSRADLLGGFLVPVCESLSTLGATVRIWPHVVNEILRGLERRAEGDAQSARQLHRLWDCLKTAGEEHLDESVHRLVRLDVIREQCVSKSVLDPARQELQPVFERLLRLPLGDAIGPTLFQELQHVRTRWPGFEAVHALPQYNSDACELLRSFLRSWPDVTGSDELREVSARILATELPRLPRARRRETWVPAAIRAFGELRSPAAPDILSSILGHRLLLWRRWPEACRRAARAALEQRHAREVPR